MTLLIILLLLMIAILLLVYRQTKTGTFLLMSTIAIFLSIGWGIVPSQLLTNLQTLPVVHAPLLWGKNNAIVVLGAGTTEIPQTHEIKPALLSYSRIYTAMQLYGSCKETAHSCTVLISGGDPLHRGQSEAAVYQQELLQAGMPAADVLLEPNSMNTYTNAQFSSAILKKNAYDYIVLVTSGIHMKRALLYFSHFAIDPVAAPADYLNSVHTIVPLAYNFAITDFALHEYSGRARFYIYNFFGWNK